MTVTPRSAAAAVFNAQAQGYEATRRKLIPSYDTFYGAVLEGLELLDAPPRRVLDLGAGTGLLARRIRAVHPQAELTLLDGAPAMLDEARAALGEDGVDYVVGDLAGPLPEGPWCAIVSSLAIHHLEDPDKQVLFTRVGDALRPGGVFVNAEQVLGATPALTGANLAWHEARAKEAGLSDDEWRAALRRFEVDRCARVEDQVRWLRDAGLSDVDVLFARRRFAVLFGRRASA